MLTGSGVDEAWTTGASWPRRDRTVRNGPPFTRENLTHPMWRAAGELGREGSRVAEKARDGFSMDLCRVVGDGPGGIEAGRLHLPLGGGPTTFLVVLEDFCRGRLDPEMRSREGQLRGESPLHDAVMRCCGWPDIHYDGQLLVSLQDALMLGGKVQAPPGFRDHVAFRDADACRRAGRSSVEMCSGQAIAPTAMVFRFSIARSACTAEPACGTARRSTKRCRRI